MLQLLISETGQDMPHLEGMAGSIAVMVS